MSELRTVQRNWLTPASYNPRRIDQTSKDRLDESIGLLGFIKPVVATEAGLLLAGHQRTEAAGRLGIEELPAWVLPVMEEHAEVRFNQLHNAGDLDCQTSKMRLINLRGGQARYKHQDIVVDQFDKHYALQYVCKMINKYGHFGSAVIDSTGRILSGQVYAMACKLLRQSLWAFRVPQGVSPAKAASLLGAQYGQFDYSRAPRTGWEQAHAQPTRRGCSSDLYRRYVLPVLDKGKRVLDYGCGQGINVMTLQRMGYRALGWEPYPRISTNTLDKEGYVASVKALAADISTHGMYDVVVCDSVTNSVDSKQAEQDVVLSLHALCKPGGLVIWSGRNREHHDLIVDGSRKVTTASRRKTHFLDEHGFSAVPGKGLGWTYQLFHSTEQAKALCSRLAGRDGAVVDYWENSYTWQAMVKRGSEPITAEEIDALEREMSLPWPPPVGRAPEGGIVLKAVIGQMRQRGGQPVGRG